MTIQKFMTTPTPLKIKKYFYNLFFKIFLFFLFIFFHFDLPPQYFVIVIYDISGCLCVPFFHFSFIFYFILFFYNFLRNVLIFVLYHHHLSFFFILIKILYYKLKDFTFNVSEYYSSSPSKG